jgi:hypothetical protein
VDDRQHGDGEYEYDDGDDEHAADLPLLIDRGISAAAV